MPAPSFRSSLVCLTLASVGLLAGCGTFNTATRNFATSITPYKIEIVQGNFISSERVAALQPGMSRLQVQEILGTPLLTSLFHADRWDYVFTLRRQGVDPQARKFAVFFKGDTLERFEGDDMPSDAEFVQGLDRRTTPPKVPSLQASDEALAAFAKKTDSKTDAATSQAAAPVATAPLPASYPPLEAPAR